MASDRTSTASEAVSSAAENQVYACAALKTSTGENSPNDMSDSFARHAIVRVRKRIPLRAFTQKLCSVDVLTH